MLKKWKEAIGYFKLSLNIYPEYLVVKYRMGYALRQLCGNKMVLTKSEYWDALKQYNECEVIFVFKEENCYMKETK